MDNKLVYISCVKEDESIAKEIASILSMYHIDSHIALQSIDNKEKMLMLNSMSILVLLFSKGVLKSSVIDNEVTEAINRHLPIIPFRIDDTSIKENLSLDFMLKKSQWVLGYPDRTKQMDDLVVSICRFMGVDAIQQNPTDPFEQLKRGIALEFGSNGLRKDRKEAMLWITKSAENGNIMAMFELYKFYLNSEDDNSYRDYNKAKEWLIKAANKGLAQAQYILGSNYEVYDDTVIILYGIPSEESHPLGIKKDLNKAKKYYTLSAKQGNKKAMFRLGMLCVEGPEEMRSDKYAFQFLSMASDINHPILWLNLGKLYKKNNDLNNALECFKKSGQWGDFEIATLFLQEKNNTNRLNEANEIIFKSIHNHDPRFLELRASLFEQGIIVEQDIHKASGYYNDAFNIYSSNYSSFYDENAGIRCLENAIKLDDIYALYKLAKYYFEHKDYKRAYLYFTEAALKGQITANFYLGYYYMYGLGVTVIDYKNAIHRLKQADVPGLPYASFLLGELHMEGKGCVQAPDTAFKYWYKSAVQNFPNAEYRLAQSYEIGYGTEKNLKLSTYWRNKAVKHGLKINDEK